MGHGKAAKRRRGRPTSIKRAKSWGVIKKLSTGEGREFGFIAVEGYARDIFFQSNELIGVTFDELREAI